MASGDTFAGTAPGEQLPAVLAALTPRDLRSIIGDDVLSLLDRQWTGSELVATVAQLLENQPTRLLDEGLSQLLFRNLSVDKKAEFERRVAFNGSRSKTERAALLGGFLGVSQTTDAVRSLPEVSTLVEPEFGLFPHQRSVVRRARRKLGGCNGRTLIHMPTGSGKTRTSMHLLAQILNENEATLVVWLASGRELLEQASEAFAKAWAVLGNREVGNYRFWGDYNPDFEAVTDGLLVAGFQKMHHWRQSNAAASMRLAARTRLVIVDEAHQAVAPSYRAVIEGLAEAGQHDALLGLSATPGRTWNDMTADKQLAHFFRDSKVVLEVDGEEDPVQYLIDDGYLAKPNFTQITYSEDSDPVRSVIPSGDESDFEEDDLEKLAQNTRRNKAIIQAVRRLLQEGHTRIILFAASVGHAQLLSTALNMDGVLTAVVTGETPTGERRRVIGRYRKRSSEPMVLCNFGVLTTGFDAPATSAAIIARPTKSLVLFSQMVGRATRGPKAGGNAASEVLTVHDPDCPGFGDIAEAFFNWEDVWSE